MIKSKILAESSYLIRKVIHGHAVRGVGDKNHAAAAFRTVAQDLLQVSFRRGLIPKSDDSDLLVSPRRCGGVRSGDALRRQHHRLLLLLCILWVGPGHRGRSPGNRVVGAPLRAYRGPTRYVRHVRGGGPRSRQIPPICRRSAEGGRACEHHRFSLLLSKKFIELILASIMLDQKVVVLSWYNILPIKRTGLYTVGFRGEKCSSSYSVTSCNLRLYCRSKSCLDGSEFQFYFLWFS